jgi:DNA invertase Pin-like site-specific DNA recombinase
VPIIPSGTPQHRFIPEGIMGTRRPAISYTRFSDPKQGKGDSEDRQAEMFRSFCTRHSLTPLTEVFADRGRSGYKDEHRKKGRFGQLVAMAKDERIEPGTIIVVEAWDRLGRLRPDKQTELVAELLRTGVSIGVCRLDDLFSEEDFGTHKWTTLAVFIQLAYQESKQKAERVADSWERRRERARTGGELLTTRLPAWLELVNGEPRLIPGRAAAVRRIFALAAEGKGHTRIVSTLTAERVPSFGRAVVNSDRVRSQFSGTWTRPYVALILNDRRALGELQPYKSDGTPDGPSLKCYPAVVSEEEFALARAGQEQRIGKDRLGRQLVPRQGKYVNLFKSMLRHARDGEGFVLHNKGTAKKPELVLVNAVGEGGRGKCYTFPYPLFEEAILRHLSEVDPAEILPRQGEAPDRVEVLRAQLKNIRADLARIQDDLKEGYSKGLAAVLREREAQEEQVATELQDELARASKPAEKAWEELPSLVGLVKDTPDPEDVRLKLRPILRRVIEEALVLIVRRGSFGICTVQIFFHGGARRSYLILHQAAGFRRKGGWWSKSFADAAALDPAALDLRKNTHARKLEKALSGVDLTGMFPPD